MDIYAEHNSEGTMNNYLFDIPFKSQNKKLFYV